MVHQIANANRVRKKAKSGATPKESHAARTESSKAIEEHAALENRTYATASDASDGDRSDGSFPADVSWTGGRRARHEC